MQISSLNSGIISLVRRNHGLEHATINLLSKKFAGTSFAGYSDHKGFWIVGDVSTDVLLEIAQQALTRMKGGERSLAIHANCGTNYVTAGLLAGTMAWLGMLFGGNSFKKKLDRWPLLVMLVTGALIVAQPLGPKVQEHVTTLGEPGNLAIKQIVRYERNIPGRPMLHRILTAEVNHAVEQSA